MIVMVMVLKDLSVSFVTVGLTEHKTDPGSHVYIVTRFPEEPDPVYLYFVIQQMPTMSETSLSAGILRRNPEGRGSQFSET